MHCTVLGGIPFCGLMKTPTGMRRDSRRAKQAAHLQVLEADLKMQLSCSCNDVLSRLLNGALHHGVGLCKPLQTCAAIPAVSDNP